MNEKQYKIIDAAEQYRKNGTKDGVPIARAWVSEKICTVYCPLCGELHTHGRPDTDLQHKLSHCSAPGIDGGYYLKIQYGKIPNSVLLSAKVWSKLHQWRFDRPATLTPEKTSADILLNEARLKFDAKIKKSECVS